MIFTIRSDVLIKALEEELVDDYEGMKVIHPAYFRLLERLGYPKPYMKDVTQ